MVGTGEDIPPRRLSPVTQFLPGANTLTDPAIPREVCFSGREEMKFYTYLLTIRWLSFYGMNK